MRFAIKIFVIFFAIGQFNAMASSYIKPSDIAKVNNSSLSNPPLSGIELTYGSGNLPIAYGYLYHSPFCVQITDSIQDPYIISQVDRVLLGKGDINISAKVSIVGGNGGNGGNGSVSDGGGGGGATFGFDVKNYARGGIGRNALTSADGSYGVGGGGYSTSAQNNASGGSGGQGGNGSGGGGGGGGFNGQNIKGGGGQGGGFVIGGSGGAGYGGNSIQNFVSGGDSDFDTPKGSNGLTDININYSHFGGSSIAIDLSANICIASGGGSLCTVLVPSLNVDVESKPGLGGRTYGGNGGGFDSGSTSSKKGLSGVGGIGGAGGGELQLIMMAVF